MYGATPDKKRADELLAKLQKTLDVYENILSKQKYIAGDELTLVDLFHIPCGALLPAAGSNAIATRPHVARSVSLCLLLSLTMFSEEQRTGPGGSKTSPTGHRGRLLKMEFRALHLTCSSSGSSGITF